MSKSTKITDEELKDLISEYPLRKIIYMHIEGAITLTSKQLDYILNMENS